MYWKRATYFWTIIGVIFAGYFLLVKSGTSSTSPILIFLVNCIGFIFSLSWFLVNRGSKFWQNNWERHVDLLEDTVMGPLYKTVIQTGNLGWKDFFKIHKEYNYSVSKVNQILSFYVTVIWFGMAIFDLNNHYWKFYLISDLNQTVILSIVTVIAACYLLIKGKSNGVNQSTKKETIIIRKREV